MIEFNEFSDYLQEAKKKVSATKKLKDISKYGPQKVNVNYVRTGMFCTYKYDSKWYKLKKLKFFDKQPLILVLGNSKGYLLGINFHYLPLQVRRQVFNKLKSLYKKQWETNKILPNVTWDLIKKELQHHNFMIKLYIISRIQGDVFRIKNTDMDSLMYARSEDFTGISAESLWGLMIKSGVKSKKLK